MAKVVLGKRLAEDEEPEEHIAAEGKRILKDMVAQQLDTSITLESLQKRERTFVPGAPLVDLAAPSGAVSSGSFGALQEKEEIRLKLLRAGVDPEDVKKLFSNETNLRLSEPERLARQQLWNEAAQKLLDADNQLSASTSSSRRRLEEELRACVPVTGFYAQFLQTQKKNLPEATKPDDDILTKELKKTEKDLFSYLEFAKAPSATGRKRRRDRKVMDSLTVDVSHETSTTNDALQPSKSTGSLWDVKRVPQVQPSSGCTSAGMSKASPESKTQSKKGNFGCSQQRFFTIKDGTIVELRGKELTEAQSSVVPSPIDAKSNRMSIDEIRAHPKFSNYQQGAPNKVLFVKNFPPRLTNAELLSLFSEYSPIDCRIMRGRMKGQAFVTFIDQESAQQALNGVIGTMIKNKPLVIQFGRSDPSDTGGT